jgi:asparagine synthase (glutamine-hydrolysing)
MDNIFGHIDLTDRSLYSNVNDIVIYFDGFIYNRAEDISNIDFIHKLYKEYDKELFSKLDGVFSLVICDYKKGIFYFARDRAGVYPLYFYTKDQTVIFGNSLKEFYKIPSFPKRISKKGLALYLNYGFILQPYTIFEDTHKVKSGHFVTYDLKDRSWTQDKYWSIEDCYRVEKPKLTEDEVIESVEDILANSIERRLKTTNNFASSLSSGYDSSIVASLLSRYSDKKINTFTIGFHEEKINEAKDAKKIADYLKTDHHEHYFSDKDALEIVPKLSEVYDEPFADYGATPTVLMSMLVKDRGFDTLFVGDGGDEVFATADDVVQFDRLLNRPTIIKNSLYSIFNSVDLSKIPILKTYQNFPTKQYKFLQLLKAKNIPEMVRIKPILFFDSEIKRLLKDDDIDIKLEEIEFPRYSESVDQVIGSYFKTSMVDAELVKSFQATRHLNLSLREPLLDINLIEYMSKVSGDLKIKDGQKKYILKLIAHKQIPKELLDRPKSGFGIPFSSWLKDPLKDMLFSHINEKRLKDDGLFDVDAVLEIRDEFYNGNESFKYKLWTLFLFQIWYKVLSNINDI